MFPGRDQMWLLFVMLMLVLTPLQGLLRVRSRRRSHERSTAAVIVASVWTALMVLLNVYLAASGSGVTPVSVGFFGLSAFWLWASVDANRHAGDA
ncbi:MAG TPA: hypothetical protein VF881_07700 [Polyangiaceae bacterium]